MRQLLRFVLQLTKVFLLFALFSIIFYFAINWFNEEYQGFKRYDNPKDGAIDVFQPAPSDDYLDRLVEFYLDGE